MAWCRSEHPTDEALAAAISEPKSSPEAAKAVKVEEAPAAGTPET